MERRSHSTFWHFFLAVACVALAVQFQTKSESPRAEATPNSSTVETETGVTQEAWNKARRLAQMGDAARHKKDWERADKLYTEALSHTWWHPIFNNRGWVRCMKGDYKGGLADAEEAIRMGSKPDDLKHYYHTKATALRGLGRSEEALEAVETSLRFDGNFLDSLELKAELKSSPR